MQNEAAPSESNDNGELLITAIRSRSLAELRELAAGRVQRQTLHAIAAAAEMDSGTLREFLNGGPITTKARSKLSRWLRLTQRHANERATSCVKMIQEVVADLPERHQPKAVRNVLSALHTSFKHGIGNVPLWLQLVLETLDAKDTPEDACADAGR